LGADEDAGFAEEVEAFDVDGAAVELGDDDGEVFGLAELVFLVGDHAGLFFSEAEEFGDGVIEEGVGDVFFIEGEIVHELIAERFFVLFVAFTGEALDEAAIGEGFGGEAGEFGDGFSAAGDRYEVTATHEEGDIDIETAEEAIASEIGGKEFRMESAIINEDR